MTDPFSDIDVETVPVTEHFGFTRIGQGEGYDKNGWAFGDADRTLLDDVLYALANHQHTGAPALGNPTDAPTLVSQPAGGHLSPSTDYFYRFSFLDQWGLETAASPEGFITTPDPIDAPTPPAASVEATGGTIAAGVVSYVLTAIDAFGGETDPSDVNDVSVITGTANRIKLQMPELEVGATAFNIYRARPGQTIFYKVGTTTAATWYDTGLTEDQTITAPLQNTTNAANSVQVSIPSGVIPLGCYGWRIYRTDVSGDYAGESLVHEVTEGVTDTDTTPVTSWLDTGDVLIQGYPLENSSTFAAPSVINLDSIQGHLPAAALPRGVQNICATAAGAISDGDTVTATETITDVKPTRFTAFFATPPSAGTAVTFHAVDAGNNVVDLVCSEATARPGDPTGYYRFALPATDAGEFQAEDGTRSDNTTVEIAPDLAAVSGQAVTLQDQGEWVQIDLGVLDAGVYTSMATYRAVATGNTVAGDLVIAAINLDDNSVLVSTSYGAGASSSTVYGDHNGPTFQAPGGDRVALRVTKAGASTQIYNIDSMAAAPVIPTLQAGLIRITASVDGAAGAADANLCLWF